MVAALAARQQLFFHAHIDEFALEELLTLYPQGRILWAHAGMPAPAQAVGWLLDRFPKLWVEPSLRSDVSLGGTLDPEWRAPFLRHSDRFLVGTDTWVTSRWETLVGQIQATEGWPSFPIGWPSNSPTGTASASSAADRNLPLQETMCGSSAVIV